MNLHEYQAKALLKKYGMPVQEGILITTPEEASAAFDQISGKFAVMKAQVHAGGRDANGQPVNSILVCEDVYPVERELYLGAVVDRSSRRVTFMASTEGGVEIEKVAEETPEKIIKVEVDPLVGLLPFQARDVGFQLGLKDKQINQFVTIMTGAYKAFVENDFALFEINPLSVRENGEILCVDAKVGIDSNALYRLPEIAAMRDKSQENEQGNIGCMVNGAGLAMATMDIIKLYGGQPANFLDVGGGATKDRVIEAFKIILSDSSVQGVLINIFGGIVRCDMIAEAIIAAVQEVNVTVPVVVRLEGNNAELGAKLLDESGLKLISANGLADAAEKVVAAVKA
ncbi:hypothetical protein FQR65_LT19381 [Abscondita terminalis]|nr:hypothetical protein FQR65_LT19381 [Abscondita terminalis]